MQIDWLPLGVGLALWLSMLWLSRHVRGGRLGFAGVGGFDKGAPGFRVWLVRILPWVRFFAFFLLVLALGRPRLGLEPVKTSDQGLLMEMVLDRSSSMTQGMRYQGANQPRLIVVKQVFERFVLGDGSALTGRPVDQIGLISFAGFAEELAPLTLDHETLNHLVQGIGPAQKFEDGTLIGDALYLATLRLIAAEKLLAKPDQPIALQGRVILLLTDGQQSNQGIHPLEAAQLAADQGIRIHCIAIVDESSLEQGFSIFAPRIDTSLLQQIAKIGGGRFFQADSGEGLIRIYQEINQLEKTSFEEHYTRYQDFAPYLIGLALALLTMEFLLHKVILRRF